MRRAPRTPIIGHSSLCSQLEHSHAAERRYDRQMDDGESIEDKAERKRGRKPGLTLAEIEERNLDLIRDRCNKQSWRHIAVKYGLSEQQCQIIYGKWRAKNQANYQGHDPIAIVHERLDQLDNWTEQLADICDDGPAATVKIAAITQQVNMAMRTVELMQATGILPPDLVTLRVQLDIQVLAMRLVQTLTDNGATPELKRAIIETLKSNGMPQSELPVATG